MGVLKYAGEGSKKICTHKSYNYVPFEEIENENKCFVLN